MAIEDELLRGAVLFPNLCEPDGRVAMKSWKVDRAHPWSEIVPDELRDGDYNFVINPQVEIVIGRLPMGIGGDNVIGHPVLGEFQPLYSAGDFRYEERKIVKIRDSSGHYQTGPAGLRVARLIFRLYGAPLSPDCEFIPYAQRASRRERPR